MPMLWRRIAWFASFAIAVTLAFWMRSLGYGWPATLGVALIVWVVLPFVISHCCAAFVLLQMQSRLRRVNVDEVTNRIAEASKGLKGVGGRVGCGATAGATLLARHGVEHLGTDG
jgi:hypothetical protein